MAAVSVLVLALSNSNREAWPAGEFWSSVVVPRGSHLLLLSLNCPTADLSARNDKISISDLEAEVLTCVLLTSHASLSHPAATERRGARSNCRQSQGRGRVDIAKLWHHPLLYPAACMS